MILFFMVSLSDGPWLGTTLWITFSYSGARSSKRDRLPAGFTPKYRKQMRLEGWNDDAGNYGIFKDFNRLSVNALKPIEDDASKKCRKSKRFPIFAGEAVFRRLLRGIRVPA
ncbi:hypothetical protein [Burkholderia sp. AU38729]|uniref:hypothetical protein n=1 Tax=Burkholderia sp. AU38729 TaxID=2879633 RepID=UPI001CF1E8F5|nr:hypothetical protein [Burkholderia sp. AU38729]MCA8063935.1 hypothetical protein [Burkholderia sp. AU38729]